MSCETRKGAHPWPPGPLGCRSGGPCQPNGQLFWRPNEKNSSPWWTSRVFLSTSATFYVLIMTTPEAFSGPETAKRRNFSLLGPLLGLFEPWGGPRGADWRPKHFHTLCLGGTHPYQVLGPLNGPLRHSWAPKSARLGLERPFWGPRRASECPGGPVFGPTVTGWSNGMTRIHIMCLGL